MSKLDDEAQTLLKLTAILSEEIEHHAWRGAVATGREVLASASKLYQRLSAIHEVMNEGYSAAEVDRAILRRDKGEG